MLLALANAKEREYFYDGKPVEVSPYDLMYTADNYYLSCYTTKVRRNKGKKTYRLDRMEDIQILSLAREGMEEFGDPKKMKLYMQKSAFNMFDGKPEDVTLVFNKSLMSTIMDKFGSDVWVTPVDANHYQVRVHVAISDQFYGWIFGLGKSITITSPPTVRKEMLKKLEAIQTVYAEDKNATEGHKS